MTKPAGHAPAGALIGEENRPRGDVPLGRDLIALAKPGITTMVVLMTAGTWTLAPTQAGASVLLHACGGVALSSAAANALNMWVEREGDGRMARTRNRPLPAGRMRASTVLAIGVSAGIAAALWLAIAVNLLTSALATGALLLYVLVYTPAKRRTTQALAIGAIPGAAPPLIGWAAATGTLNAGALVLFLVLAIWQLPHFLAISLYRKRDYAEAGILIIPVVRGDEIAKLQSVLYTVLLTPVSLLLVPLGLAGYLYFVLASLLGLGFLLYSLVGLEEGAGSRWARSFFLYSLIYLPALVAALAADRWLEAWLST